MNIHRFARWLKDSKPLSSKEEGFTVIEIVSAIAILGVLTAIAVPSIIAYQRQIQTSSLLQELQTAGNNIMTEALDNNGLLPTYIPNEVLDVLNAHDQKAKDGYMHLNPANFVYTYSDDRVHWCLQTDAPIVGPGDTGKLFLSDSYSQPSQEPCTYENIASNSATPWVPPTVAEVAEPTLSISWAAPTGSTDANKFATAQVSWTGVTCNFDGKDVEEWGAGSGNSHVEYLITLKNTRSGEADIVRTWAAGNDAGANFWSTTLNNWYDTDQVTATIDTRCVVNWGNVAPYESGSGGVSSIPQTIQQPAVPKLIAGATPTVTWGNLTDNNSKYFGPTVKFNWKSAFGTGTMAYCPGNGTPGYIMSIRGKTVSLSAAETIDGIAYSADNSGNRILSPSGGLTTAATTLIPAANATNPSLYTGTGNAGGLITQTFATSWGATQLIPAVKGAETVTAVIYSTCTGTRGGIANTTENYRYVSDPLTITIGADSMPLQPPAGGNAITLGDSSATKRLLTDLASISLTKCQSGQLQYKLMRILPAPAGVVQNWTNAASVNFTRDITAQYGTQNQYGVMSRCISDSGTIATCPDTATTLAQCPTYVTSNTSTTMWGRPDAPGGAFTLNRSADGDSIVKDDFAYWDRLEAGINDTSTSQTNTQNTTYKCDIGTWPQFRVTFSTATRGSTTLDVYANGVFQHTSYFGNILKGGVNYNYLKLPLVLADAGSPVSVTVKAHCVGGNGQLSSEGPSRTLTWTPPAKPNPPAAPKDVTTLANAQVYVDWNTGSACATGSKLQFQVVRVVNGSTNETSVRKAWADATTYPAGASGKAYRFNEVGEQGWRYQYQIQARCAGTNGFNSDPVSTNTGTWTTNLGVSGSGWYNGSSTEGSLSKVVYFRVTASCGNTSSNAKTQARLRMHATRGSTQSQAWNLYLTDSWYYIQTGTSNAATGGYAELNYSHSKGQWWSYYYSAAEGRCYTPYADTGFKHFNWDGPHLR